MTPSRALNRCSAISIHHLPRLLSSSRRMTTSPILKGVWPADSETVVVYSQVQRFQRTWREFCMSHAIQAQTQRAFGRSYRSSEWSYLPGHQSTVAAAITSRTILDSPSHSLMVVVTGFGRHVLKQQPGLLHQNAASVTEPPRLLRTTEFL